MICIDLYKIGIEMPKREVRGKIADVVLVFGPFYFIHRSVGYFVLYMHNVELINTLGSIIVLNFLSVF